jgi:hypothetical protein
MAAAAGPSVREAPATLAGLFAAPCDALVLRVEPTAPLPPLTALVDWRLAGRVSRLVRDAALPADAPLLVPGSPLLPPTRLLLLRAGVFTPPALVLCLRGLGAAPVGICPEDFGWTSADLAAALAGLPHVLYRGATP